MLAVAAGAVAASVRGLPRVGRSARGVLRDPGLLPLGVLQAATFGLAVIAGNWAVPLLEREDASSAVAGGLGGLVLLAGIVTRPLGGRLVHRRPAGRATLVAVSLAAKSDHGGRQFRRLDRFGEMELEARLQRAGAIGGPGIGGESRCRDRTLPVARTLPDRPQQFVAVG